MALYKITKFISRKYVTLAVHMHTPTQHFTQRIGLFNQSTTYNYITIYNIVFEDTMGEKLCHSFTNLPEITKRKAV